MSHRIGTFAIARSMSQRCPNKMLRDFGGTTLTDIALDKLSKLGPDSFLAARDPAFRAKAEGKGVRFVERSEKSVSIDGPIVDILGFLRDLPYTHFLIVNGCMPFLTLETIQSFMKECVDLGCKPSFSVMKEQNFYFDKNRKPMNFDIEMQTINSKAVEPVYKFAHALYFFEKDYFFKNGRYWDWRDVRLVELHDQLEIVDIDTEDDFKFAELMWKSGYAGAAKRG